MLINHGLGTIYHRGKEKRRGGGRVERKRKGGGRGDEEEREWRERVRRSHTLKVTCNRDIMFQTKVAGCSTVESPPSFTVLLSTLHDDVFEGGDGGRG